MYDLILFYVCLVKGIKKRLILKSLYLNMKLYRKKYEDFKFVSS